MTTEAAPVAFVTGSARRLGRHIAHALADAGYDVVLHAHASAQLLPGVRDEIAEHGRQAWTVEGDLADLQDLQRVAEEVERLAPRLDLLVHNAAVFPNAPFGSVTPDVWDRTIAVNTRAVFFLTQQLADMLRAAGGSVVAIASAGGFQPWTSHIPYNVSKAGVLMLTRALAKALAPEVRVNAVAPGIIEMPGEGDPPLLDPRHAPLGRHGSPLDVADAVLFLARASYITGHVLPIDGGTVALT